MEVDNEQFTLLHRNSNQARGLATFAIQFLSGKLGKGPSHQVFERVEWFHIDSVYCGLSAIALGTNAPTLLREEAIEDYSIDFQKSSNNPNIFSRGATLFGFDSKKIVQSEKAIVANIAAVREWDSNGTVFGYNERLGPNFTAGEFGHNDFYSVVIAACQQNKLDGKKAILGMLLLDEIRGRLAEVFSLKSFKIDHVVHGAIALDQIEHAIGMVVAHYIPFRAIRAGHQLSDSKGASAALSAEVAVMSVKRAMRGFIGPKDIFRNPEAIFRNFKKTPDGESPFDLVLTHSGSEFAVMGMHFKLGIYEHQSAGALQGILDLLSQHQNLISSLNKIKSICIIAYEPAFGIIGDPAKRDPHTRQSADHSMVYIIATTIRKAIQLGKLDSKSEQVWSKLMLLPEDFSQTAINDKITRNIIEKITFEHGGPDYDSKYPDGIPTTVIIKDLDDKEYSSGLVMYPVGHARNKTHNLEEVLKYKWKMLGNIALQDPECVLKNLSNLQSKSVEEIADLYAFKIETREKLQ